MGTILDKANILTKTKLDSLDTKQYPNQAFITTDERDGELAENLAVQFAESERQKSKNLFNVTKAEPQGYSWQGVPSPYPNDSYISCGFIKIKPNTNYIFSLADSSITIRYTGALFYTADKTYIGYDECNKYTFKTPSNAEYMICQFWFESNPMNYKDIIQIEEGSSATKFQPYNGPILHNTDEPVVFAETERQKSKNLLNLRQNHTELYGVSYSYNEPILSVNTLDEYPYHYVFFPLNVEVGKTYTISCNCDKFGYVAIFNKALSKSYVDINVETQISVIFTPSEDVEYVIGFYGRIGEGIFNYSNIQVEEGSVATDYQPYNGPIMHKDDSPVKFAEKHYLESVNLFDIKDAVVNPNVTTYGYIPIKNIKDKYVISLQNGKASYVEGLAFGICKDPSSPTSMTNGGYTWMVETSYLRHTKVEANITDRPYIVFYPNNYETLKKLVDNFDVQINEGSQMTDYQPFKGKVIHEEDLAEPLYDKNSLDPDINLGLPAGILFSGTTINTTIKKSKEKFRHIRYTIAFDENRKMCITVRNQHRLQTRAIFAGEADWNGTYICMGGIVLQPDGGIFGWCKSVSLSSEFARIDYNNNSKFYIEKIEGVY